MDIINNALQEAKKIKEINNWEEMEYATEVANALALVDSKEATKQFDRLTTLLGTCVLPA